MIWPVILGGIFISFCLFYYLDEKRKIRNEQKRKRNSETFEKLLDKLKHPIKLTGVVKVARAEFDDKND